MAKKLPKYEKTAGFNYEGMAQLTDVVTRQEAATGERINKFLSGVTQDFRQQGIQYATDQAIEDAIRNPITKSQIDVARATGDNPVTKYLQGGTAYNEAMTKMLGQQVAGELNITLAKHNSDLLEQVRLGQIENSETLLLKLSEPIKAQVEFFTDIDPEMAAQFGANATLSAKNTYSSGVKIFEGLKEEKAYADATTTINNGTDEFSTFMDNYPDATPEQILARKETIEKVAIDTSLSMSRKQRELTEQLINKLNEVEDAHVAKDIAIKYKGNKINEVLNELTNDKTNVGEYYNKKNILQKDVFTRQIANALSVQNSGLAQIQREVTHNIGRSNSFLKFQQPIPDDIKNFINKNIDVDSTEYKDWKITELFSDNIETYNSTPYVELVSSLNSMNERLLNPNIETSYEEIKTTELLTNYVKNVQTQLNNDPVGIMLKRAGEYKPLDLSNPDILKEQVTKRRSLVGTYGPLYGMSESQFDQNIMTKSEVNSFVGAYKKGDGATRVAMLRMIDDSFGDSNSSALLQLVNDGLPTTAELSSYIGDPNVTERFLSFDDPDEQERLTKVATQKNTSYNEVSRAVANKLQGFSNMVMMQNPFNKSTATAKMANINDALTYYAINEMQSGKSMASAIEEATNLINNDFQIENTYLIPKKYNGQPINADDVATKANRIKDIELAKFNAVPFDSFLDIPEDERQEEFNDQLIENGRWVNTADGTGLMFVIVLNDGSFAPIENINGENLKFNFNDTDMIIPTTDIDISAPKNETRLERIGKQRRAERALENKRDIRY